MRKMTAEIIILFGTVRLLDAVRQFLLRTVGLSASYAAR